MGKTQKAAKEGELSALWFTRTDMAAACDLSPRQFDAVIRPRLPADAVRGQGATLRYYGPVVVDVYADYRVAQLTTPCPTCGRPMQK
jgi:23S rRNA G2069 N7-methylase RlmK/C1962 C5-methylase RlmI